MKEHQLLLRQEKVGRRERGERERGREGGRERREEGQREGGKNVSHLPPNDHFSSPALSLEEELMGVVSPDLLAPARAELEMLQKEQESWRAEKERLEREREEARSAREALER